MACLTGFLFALLFGLATAQLPIQSFFNVPATAFNRGGRVDFTGLSLGQICKQLVLLGGKEALSDGMGMAAKWFSSQRAPSQLAGGTDPQMQCLYSQATGGMIPGTTGPRDPGNMFGDYYDTVIEYPIILDPCTAPQCNGKVNPTVLLMQAFGRFGGPGAGLGGMPGAGLGGMPGAGLGGGMPGAGFGGGMPGALGGSMPGAALGGSMPGGMTNPLASMGQNPLLAALMPNPAPGIPVPAPGNGTSQYLPVTPGPVASAAASAASLPQILQGSPMSSMMQNPQLMQMMQMLQGLMKNGQSPTGLNTNPAFSPFGSLGFPLGSMFL